MQPQIPGFYQSQQGQSIIPLLSFVCFCVSISFHSFLFPSRPFYSFILQSFLSHFPTSPCLNNFPQPRSSVPVGRLGKLLMAVANTVILGSGSLETRDHILLSHDSGICATADSIFPCSVSFLHLYRSLISPPLFPHPSCSCIFRHSFPSNGKRQFTFSAYPSNCELGCPSA